MNVSEISVGSTFITSAMLIERAVYCGVFCSGIDKLPDGKTKVILRRMSGGEDFSFFSDEQGDIQLGNWIPCKDLATLIEECRNLEYYIENDKQTILVAEKNLKDNLNKMKEILKEAISF